MRLRCFRLHNQANWPDPTPAHIDTPPSQGWGLGARLGNSLPHPVLSCFMYTKRLIGMTRPTFSPGPFSRVGRSAFHLQHSLTLLWVWTWTHARVCLRYCTISLVPHFLSQEREREKDGSNTMYWPDGSVALFQRRSYISWKKRPPHCQKKPRRFKAPKDRESWASDFPCLVISEDDCGEQGMLCSICCKTNCRPVQALLGKAVWIEIPCKTITRQSRTR